MNISCSKLVGMSFVYISTFFQRALRWFKDLKKKKIFGKGMWAGFQSSTYQLQNGGIAVKMTE